MKKLLFTAIAAAGAAFGLQAAVTLPSGTSFEGVDASAAPVALNGASGVDYLGVGGSFSFPTGDYKADITAYATGEAPRHIDAFSAVDGNCNFLDVKTTFGNPLNYGLEDAQDIGEGLYFDSLVKFTACDEAPTTDSYTDAKIVVWVQEDEDNHTTNFWVKAGQYANSAWGSAAYKCTNLTDFDMTAFHRLTIKAIKDITTNTTQGKEIPGFVVFVDGEKVIRPTTGGEDPGLSALTLNASAAEFDNGKALFPSLIRGTLPAIQIASVGFDGQGAIDDIVLTATAPDFAKDNEFFTVAMGENVTGFKYAVNSEEAVAATAAVQLPYTLGMTVTISDVTCGDGFMYKKLEGDTGVTVSGNVFTPTAKDLTGTIIAQAVGVTIGNQKFANLAAAITYINGTDASGALAVSFASGYTPDSFATGIKPGDNVTSLTIDLAGKTLTYTGDGNAIEAAVPLFVTNSTETVGKIVANDASAAIRMTGGNLTVYDGIFDGAVQLAGRPTATAELFGGQYLAAKNQTEDEPPAFTLAGSVANGYQPTLNNGYYVVSPYAPAGDGESPETAFEIDSVQALNWVKDQVAAGNTFAGKFLKQTADIDFDGAVFEGIGTEYKSPAGDNSFKGTYDGQNFEIKNFRLGTLTTYQGFFNSICAPAVVKNLTLTANDFENIPETGDYGAAVFAGTIKGNVNVINVTTKGQLTGRHNTAGIAAKLMENPTLTACTNEATIVNNLTVNPKAGGMAALCEGATFVDCYNKGAITVTHKKVTSTEYGGAVGGLVAWMQSSNSSITGGGNEGTISVGNLEADGTAGVTCGSLIGSVAGQTTTIAAGVKTLSNQLAVGGMGSPKTPDDGTLVGGMFVADGVTVTPVKNGSYKVVAPRAVVPAIELGAGDTLTIDTTLATAVDTAVTAASGLDLVTDKTTAVWTYSTKATEIPVTSVTIDQGETAEVEIGKTIALTATVKPDDATDPEVTWTSGDTSKATVTDAGVVTGVAAGDVVITATAGDKTDTITITVKAAYPTYIPDDPVVQAKYEAWKTKYGDDTGSAYEEAFLLDCDPKNVEAAKAAFKITSITQDSDGNWVAEVGDAGEGEEYKNGYIHFISVKDTFGADGVTADFFKAQLLIQPVAE